MDKLFFDYTSIIEFENGEPSARYVEVPYESHTVKRTAYFMLPTHLCYSSSPVNNSFIISSNSRANKIFEKRKFFTIPAQKRFDLSAILTQYENAIDYLSQSSAYTKFHHFSACSLKATDRNMYHSYLPHIGCIQLDELPADGVRKDRLSAQFRYKNKYYRRDLAHPSNHEEINKKLKEFILKTGAIRMIIDRGCMELFGLTNPNHLVDMYNKHKK